MTFKYLLQVTYLSWSLVLKHNIEIPHLQVVVASFECLIPGREGRGTDVMQFDEDLRVTGVAAVRHHEVKS